MRIRVVLATLVILLFLVGSLSAQIPTPSSHSGTAIGVRWVRPGSHGDVFRHNTAASCGYYAPTRTVFGINDSLWMRTYVVCKQEDTFHGTWFLWDRIHRKLYTFDNIWTLTPANWCICMGFADGMGVTGEYIFSVKVTTGSGTEDMHTLPLAIFSVQ